MTLTIHNGCFTIQFQKPGSRYKRSRFDWSGICQQILFEQNHKYLSKEATAEEPGSEGVGLIDEFGIHSPIGYDQVKTGDWFPKIGVGFLQKENHDPYDFFSDFAIRPAPIHVEQANDEKISFLQESEVLDGWGWRLRKTFTLDGPDLIVDYALENCGQKPFTTEQYNHNFIAINGEKIGPDYQLRTSFPLNFESVDGGIQIDEDKINLTEVPPTYIYALQIDCTNLQDVEWDLVHQPSGHGIRVREQFPLHKFALWGKSHVLSPEFFIWIDLQPGQTQTWQRVYHLY